MRLEFSEGKEYNEKCKEIFHVVNHEKGKPRSPGF